MCRIAPRRSVTSSTVIESSTAATTRCQRSSFMLMVSSGSETNRRLHRSSATSIEQRRVRRTHPPWMAGNRERRATLGAGALLGRVSLLDALHEVRDLRAPRVSGLDGHGHRLATRSELPVLLPLQA